MIGKLQVKDFLEAFSNGTGMLDVRSEAEFTSGHIPGAVNVPLFTNEERSIIGTIYKKNGKAPAVKQGLQIVGPKLEYFISEFEKVSANGKLLFNCWRGGMRSESMAWLASTIDIQTYTLIGGYKAYRRMALEVFSKPLNLVVLGGKTGSGKTMVLEALRKLGEQVINLEELANHRGSAFGALGMMSQPTTEHFENVLFDALTTLHPARRIWVEDESHMIGTVYLNNDFFRQKSRAPMLYLEVSIKCRIKNLVNEYGQFPVDELKESFLKISKRLGGQNVKLALESFQKNDLEKVAEIALGYYDKTYLYGITKKIDSYISTLNADKLSPDEIAGILIKEADDKKL